VIVAEKRARLVDNKGSDDDKDEDVINKNDVVDDLPGMNGDKQDRIGIELAANIRPYSARLIMLKQWQNNNHISQRAMDTLLDIDRVTIPDLANYLRLAPGGDVINEYPRYTVSKIKKYLHLIPVVKEYVVCVSCFALHQPKKVYRLDTGDDGYPILDSIQCHSIIIGDEKCTAVLYNHDRFIGSETSRQPLRLRPINELPHNPDADNNIDWKDTTNRTLFIPKQLYLYRSLTDHLHQFFRRPIFEESIELWRQRQYPLGAGPPPFPPTRCDIYDGNIYRRRVDINGDDYYRPHLPSDMNGRIGISVTLNLDWFGIYDTSSHYSAGTIYLTIDQLPYDMRLQRQWVIALAALPGGSEKNININYLLEPLIQELMILYTTGIIIQSSRYPNGRRVECILSCVLCDSMAARRTIGFVGPVGNKGCHICWATFGSRSCTRESVMSGEPLSTSSSDSKEESKGAVVDDDDEVQQWSEDDEDDGHHTISNDGNSGDNKESKRCGAIAAGDDNVPNNHRIRVCLNDIYNIVANERTREQHVRYGIEYHNARNRSERVMITRQTGYMSCALLTLPYFIPSQHTPVDYLHVLPLGVAKHLYNKLASGWSSSILLTIQKRLDDISPPRSLSRAPMRFTAVMKKMTGHMMITFVTSYSLYVLEGILTRSQLLVWYTLVIIMRICSQHEITAYEINRLTLLIKQLINGVNELYPNDSIPPNYHQLTHLPSCIMNYGPPMTIWTFGHERINGWMSNIKNNRLHPDQQLIRHYWESTLLADALVRYNNVHWSDDMKALMIKSRYIYPHTLNHDNNDGGSDSDKEDNDNDNDDKGNVMTTDIKKRNNHYISRVESERLRYWCVRAHYMTGNEMYMNGDGKTPSYIRLLNYHKRARRYDDNIQRSLRLAFTKLLYPRSNSENKNIVAIDIPSSHRVARRLQIGNDIITSESWRTWRESYIMIHRAANNDDRTRLSAGRVIEFVHVMATIKYDGLYEHDRKILYEVPHLLARVRWFDFPVPSHPSLEDSILKHILGPSSSSSHLSTVAIYGNAYSWNEWQPPTPDDTYHSWIPVQRLRRMMTANVTLSNNTAGFYSLWLPSSYDHTYD
jgi:predicted XRE-type DNA-binding protein